MARLALSLLLLTRILTLKNKSLGIIAVDPSSPFTGGALLGDRIRMQHIPAGKGVFIRSMATRGSCGGLATATKDVSLVLDAFGKDYILIETVGVGQIELDIANACDTTVVVLVPESGDSIQAMKAGLMEIADIIVVNKSDREAADRFIQELESVLKMREDHVEWHVPVISTQALNNEGITHLFNAVMNHAQWLTECQLLDKNRKRQIQHDLIYLVEAKIKDHLYVHTLNTSQLDRITEEIFLRKIDPYSVADTFFNEIIE